MSSPKNQSGISSAKTLDLLIVGSGFAGMFLLKRAREIGLSTHVYDAASDVGGTWFWNRYPGARCDIESMQYSYSWDEKLEQDWHWTERFATQPEILRYAQYVADKHDFRRDITFNTRVISTTYDADKKLWNVTLDSGETICTRFCVLATGCLSAARLPDLPGRDDFEGAVYHTGNWPHEGVDFTDKKVAVIGTGSSAIQVIPEIAAQAGQLTVFQRTPNFCVPARNQPLNAEFIEGWKTQYPKLREYARSGTGSGTIYDFSTRSALDVTPLEREQEYRWRWEKGGANFMHAFNDLITNEDSNKTAADFVRDRIREAVKNPVTAEALCPYDYPIFTKRICIGSQYYETYNRQNVELVNLRETPLEKIMPSGIVTSDRLREFDIIVYATGFDAMTGAITSIDIQGRNGLTIVEKWAEGPQAYLGLASEGFPNLFMITGPGSPSVLSNVIVSIEQHVEWIAALLKHAKVNQIETVEANRDAEQNWVGHVRDVANETLLPQAASWYMGANIPGKPRVFMPYIGVSKYRNICDEVAANNYDGFTLTAQNSA